MDRKVLFVLLLACFSSALAQERVDWIRVNEEGKLCIRTGFLTLCSQCTSAGFNLDGVRYETAGSDWYYRASSSDTWTKMSGESSSGSVCSLSSLPTRPGQYRPIIKLRVDGVLREYTSVNILTIEGEVAQDEPEEEEVAEEGEDEEQVVETAVETATWGQIKSLGR